MFYISYKQVIKIVRLRIENVKTFSILQLRDIYQAKNQRFLA